MRSLAAAAWKRRQRADESNRRSRPGRFLRRLQPNQRSIQLRHMISEGIQRSDHSWALVSLLTT